MFLSSKYSLVHSLRLSLVSSCRSAARLPCILTQLTPPHNSLHKSFPNNEPPHPYRAQRAPTTHGPRPMPMGGRGPRCRDHAHCHGPQTSLTSQESRQIPMFHSDCPRALRHLLRPTLPWRRVAQVRQREAMCTCTFRHVRTIMLRVVELTYPVAPSTYRTARHRYVEDHDLKARRNARMRWSLSTREGRLVIFETSGLLCSVHRHTSLFAPDVPNPALLLHFSLPPPSTLSSLAACYWQSRFSSRSRPLMPNQTHTVKVDASDTSRFTYYNVLQYGPYHGQGWSILTGASGDPDKEGPIYNNTLQVAPLEDISVEFPFNGECAFQHGASIAMHARPCSPRILDTH